MRYLKRYRTGIQYRKAAKPVRLVACSDAAFKAQVGESSALACRGLAVVLCTDQATEPTSPNDSVNLVEFLVRRQKRVVRSTFGGELNALLDAAENVLLMQLALHEIFHGTDETQEVLMDRLECGE